MTDCYKEKRLQFNSIIDMLRDVGERERESELFTTNGMNVES